MNLLEALALEKQSQVPGAIRGNSLVQYEEEGDVYFYYVDIYDTSSAVMPLSQYQLMTNVPNADCTDWTPVGNFIF